MSLPDTPDSCRTVVVAPVACGVHGRFLAPDGALRPRPVGHTGHDLRTDTVRVVHFATPRAAHHVAHRLRGQGTRVSIDDAAARARAYLARRGRAAPDVLDLEAFAALCGIDAPTRRSAIDCAEARLALLARLLRTRLSYAPEGAGRVVRPPDDPDAAATRLRSRGGRRLRTGPWSPAEIALALRLSRDGVAADAISAALARSPAAVRARLARTAATAPTAGCERTHFPDAARPPLPPRRPEDRPMPDTDTAPSGSPAPRARMSDAIMARRRAEEPGLIRAWQAEGSEQALGILLKRYHPLIRKHVGRTLTRSGLPAAHRADLEQEASLAFVKAANRFDPEKHATLGPLAATYVENAMRRYTLDNVTAFRIGTNSDERKAYYGAIRLGHARNRIRTSSLSDSDAPALAEMTGTREVTAQHAIRALTANVCPVETAEGVAEPDNVTASDRQMSQGAALRHLAADIAAMSRAERRILAALLDDAPFPRAALAAELGVSPRKVARLRDGLLDAFATSLTEAGITAESLFG